MKIEEQSKLVKIVMIMLIVLFITISCVEASSYVFVGEKGDVSSGDGVIIHNSNYGQESVEIFNGFAQSCIDWDGIPKYALAGIGENGISLWCIEKGGAVATYTTAPESYYWAYKNNEASNTLDENSVYRYYLREVISGVLGKEGAKYLGFIGSYKTAYDEHKNFLANGTGYFGQPGETNHTGNYNIGKYEDDQDIIDELDETWPGTNIKKSDKSVLYSINWRNTKFYTQKGEINPEYQDVLFIFTQPAIYENASSIPNGEILENLTDEEIAAGTFTDIEKQYALWKTALAQANSGTDVSNLVDRGLSKIAKEYKEFHKVIHNEGIDIIEEYYVKLNDHFEDKINDKFGVYSIDKEGGKSKITPVNEKFSDGNEYRTYEYEEEDVKVVADKTDVQITVDGDSSKWTYKSVNAYLIGPFCVDYTIDDINSDIHYFTDVEYELDEDGNIKFEYDEEYMIKDEEGNPVLDEEGNPTYSEYYKKPIIKEPTGEGKQRPIKFNAIKDIKVYNQNKIDITTLGASFSIVHEYTNGSKWSYDDRTFYAADEVKTVRINDKYYYEAGDGSEVKGFYSGMPFYIAVYTDSNPFEVEIDGSGSNKSINPEDLKGLYAKIDFQYLESIEGTLAEFEGDVYKYNYAKKSSAVEGTGVEDYNYTIEGNYEYRYSYTPTPKPTPKPTSTPIPTPTPTPTTATDWTSSNRTGSATTYMYELERNAVNTKGQKLVGYYHDGWRNYKEYSIVLKYTPEEEETKPIEIEIYKYCDQCGALYGGQFDVTLNIENIGTVTFPTLVTDTEGKIKITDTMLLQKGISLKGFTGNIDVTIVERTAPGSHRIVQGTTTLNMKGGTSASISINNEHIPDRTPDIEIEKTDENGNLLAGTKVFFDVHVSYTDENGVLIDDAANIIRGQTYNGILKLTDADFSSMPNGFSLTNYTGKITLDIVEVGVERRIYYFTKECRCYIRI